MTKRGHTVKNKYWSTFVYTLLSKADEKYTRQYELKRPGYNLDKMMTELARLFVMSPSAIGHFVQKCDAETEKNIYPLMG